MPSTCLILVSPSEVTKVINHKNHIDYEFIIPLTPDTYSFLLKTKKFEEKRIIDLSDINFKDLHERIAINLIKYDERIISKVLKEESISKAIRQNLTSELYCFLGSSEYLYSILEKYNKFVFYKQGFNETTDIGTLVSSVMEKLIKNSQGIFSTPSLSKLSK